MSSRGEKQSKVRVSGDQSKLTDLWSKSQGRDQDKARFLSPEQQPILSNSTLPDNPNRANTSGDQRDSRDPGGQSNPIVIDSDEQPTEDEDQQRMSGSPSPAPGGTGTSRAAAVRFSLQDIGTSRQGGAASAITATTRGGCTFEDLSRGSLVSYACDNLIKINGKTDGIDEAEEKICKHVENCINDIKLQSDKKVKRLYFGKTCIHRRKQRRGYVKFDSMDHKTWKKTGISSRWQYHKGKDHAKNGMVVLAAIQKESIPEKCRETRKDVHQEDYALALEQRLIQHYLFREGDERLENKTLTAGGSDGRKSIAYALYMTFTLKD